MGVKKNLGKKKSMHEKVEKEETLKITGPSRENVRNRGRKGAMGVDKNLGKTKGCARKVEKDETLKITGHTQMQKNRNEEGKQREE